MKCMRVDKDGIISEVFLNEACSSGCGSFIQTLAGSLKMDLPSFVEAGIRSKNPIDLGSKCTVFMNSRYSSNKFCVTVVESSKLNVMESLLKICLQGLLYLLLRTHFTR